MGTHHVPRHAKGSIPPVKFDGAYNYPLPPDHSLSHPDVGKHSAARSRSGAGDVAQEAPRGSKADTQRAPKTSLARSSLVMAGGTLASRILGMVRAPMLLGAVVATNTPVAQAFDIANKLPNMLYMVIAGGLVNAVLVPAIVRASSNSEDGGQSFINKLLTITLTMLGVLTGLLMLLAPVIVKFFAAAMPAQWFDVTVFFALWCLPQVLFYGLYTILGQILNARENFGPYMWAPVLNNLVAIVGMILIVQIWGVEHAADPSSAASWLGPRGMMLAGFSTAGIALQALVLIIPMRRLGIHFRPDFQWRGAGLGRVGKASLWIIFGTGLGLIPNIILSNAAVHAVARAQDLGIAISHVASNQAYSNAWALYILPSSLVTISVTTAMFTRMSAHAVEGKIRELVADTSHMLRMLAVFNFLAMAAFIVMAVPLTRVVNPAVTSIEITTTARVLIGMSIGLVAGGMVTALLKVFYALEDTRSAVLLGLTWQIIQVVGYSLAFFLPPEWVVAAIGLVIALSNIAGAGALFKVLSSRLGGLDGERLTRVHIKLTACALVSGAVGAGLMVAFSPEACAASFMRSLLAIVVISPVMAGVYFSMMKALKVDEARYATGALTKIAGKLRR